MWRCKTDALHLVVTEKYFRNLLKLNQIEIRLYLPFYNWFGSKRTSVWIKIIPKMVNTIWFRVDLIRSGKKFSVCSAMVFGHFHGIIWEFLASFSRLFAIEAAIYETQDCCKLTGMVSCTRVAIPAFVSVGVKMWTHFFTNIWNIILFWLRNLLA